MINTRIILTHPSHPGNIGATARAMKNMGLNELYLVKPKLFPHHEATVRASGADDILRSACVVDTLADALVGCQLTFATSARNRRLEWPLCTPREAASQIGQQPHLKSAIVFGRESSGLTNDELSLCQTHIHIPTQEEFSSLNLAAAVQVIVYELLATNEKVINEQNSNAETLATMDEQNRLIEHLRGIMIHVNFLNPRQPRKLTQRLRRLIARAKISQTEVNILRGFLSAVDKKIK